jgi:hypothetical protein
VTSTNATDGPRPARAIVAVAALVAAQAVALLVVAAFYALELVRGDAADPTVAIAIAVLCLVAGAGLGFTARGLLARRRWSRAPALVANLLALPVVWPFFTEGRPVVGAALVAWAVAVVVLLFAAGARDALDG